jgi:hypothetical protein
LRVDFFKDEYEAISIGYISSFLRRDLLSLGLQLADNESLLSKHAHHAEGLVSLKVRAQIFTRVGTYVQRGSKFCFVVVLLGADTLLKFLNYCPISPCIQQPCPAALPGSLALAALPGSLARQPCPAALPGSLALAALLGSLARQLCPAVRPISTGFDARARSAVTALYYIGRSPNCMHALLS